MISHQPHRPGAVTVPVDQVRTLLAALGEAAESRRDQAAMRADCADQSCATCHWRLQAADAYDQVAEMIQAAETATTQHVPSHTAPVSGGQQTAADREAGQ
jgi:ferredoxin